MQEIVDSFLNHSTLTQCRRKRLANWRARVQLLADHNLGVTMI